MVYVISKNKKPLMPCSNVIARLLLKNKKARVKSKCPFTIILLYDLEKEYLQNLTLGVDTGSSIIGTAVVNDNGNVLYMSKVIVRNDICDKMKTRLMYRRNRRYRKTKYRKARWLNRKNSIKTNRFSPTIISKFKSHVREIEYIKSILPITNLILETGTFDLHLMKNPKINKHWGYQKGTNYGFSNTKEKVLYRDNHTCQLCKGKSKDSKLEVHHIIYRSNGGSDEEDNLITLCKSCHDKVHKGLLTVSKIGKVKGTLKHATQMNVLRNQLLLLYQGECIETFGYITKTNRLLQKLPKDHNIDACIIASGGNKISFKNKIVYIKRNVPKGDYQRTSGSHSEKFINQKKICGFRKFDKVRYRGKNYFIKGRMSTGYAILIFLQKYLN